MPMKFQPNGNEHVGCLQICIRTNRTDMQPNSFMGIN